MTAAHATSYAYVGSHTTLASGGVFGGDGEGIYVFAVADGGGSVTLIGVEPLADPTFMAVSHARAVLYAASHSVWFEGDPGAGVTAFRIGADGHLKRLDSQRIDHPHATMISFAADERFLLVASSMGGAVTAIGLEPDGRFGGVADVARFEGEVVVGVGETPPSRPLTDSPSAVPGMSVRAITRFPAFGPNTTPHSVRQAVASPHVLITDTSANGIGVLGFDAERGAFTSQKRIRLGRDAGPRILELHPNGHTLYSVNEVDATVSVFELDPETAAVDEVQHLPTVPDTFTNKNTGSGIVIDPSARFLYAANRGFNHIAIFSIDEPGRLEPAGFVPSGGLFPLHVALTPDGRALWAANNLSATVDVFAVDADTGGLTPIAKAPVPNPTSTVFAAV